MNSESTSRKRLVLFFGIMAMLPVLLFCLGYVALTAFRSVDAYVYLKSKQRGWEGNVHSADPELGFAPIPNAVGAHVFPIGPNIPMRYDEHGFRVPVDARAASEHQAPVVMALGCSFTYGDANYATDAYPYLVAKSLGGREKNAGVCSHGLAQMLILAEKVIDEHRPDYLLIQFSPWLVDRARNPFAPAYLGRLPTPFFYENQSVVKIFPPVFLTKVGDLPIGQYRQSEQDWTDALSFFWHVGLPLYVHDDVNMVRYGLGRLAGWIPEPTRKEDEIIRHVYNRIASIASANGSRSVIVIIGNGPDSVDVNRNLLPNDALIVDAHEALRARLPELTPEAYQREYAIWRGTPARIVDTHPNETAHQVIAEAIVSAIRRETLPQHAQ